MFPTELPSAEYHPFAENSSRVDLCFGLEQLVIGTKHLQDENTHDAFPKLLNGCTKDINLHAGNLANLGNDRFFDAGADKFQPVNHVVPRFCLEQIQNALGDLIVDNRADKLLCQLRVQDQLDKAGQEKPVQDQEVSGRE